MPKLPKLLTGALLALAGGAALSTAAEADHRDRSRWSGPEGYFVVDARACPDLREDLRDRRHGRYDPHDRYGHERGYGYGRSYGHRGSDWRDRRVLECPRHAWTYVPSARERRMGRYGYRLNPTHAYYDRRQGHYHVETRWGLVPVRIDWQRGHHHRGYTNSGLSFQFRF